MRNRPPPPYRARGATTGAPHAAPMGKPDPRRTHTINLCVSAAELATLKAEAARRGLPLNVYLRMRALYEGPELTLVSPGPGMRA